MIKNYLKIAWRNLKRNKLYSIINLGGLSVSLAVAILLYIFVMHELSFDTMYSREKDIYRVLLHTDGNGTWSNAPNAIAPAMTNGIPEVKNAARLLKHGFGTTAFIEADHKNFTEKYFYWSDEALFHIFNVSFIRGNPKTALENPNTVVLSASVAKKYFGEENPMGKIIMVDNNQKLEITGVYKDLPDNSTLDGNIFASYKSTNFSKRTSWSNASFETYCLLDAQAKIPVVEQKMQQILNKNVTSKDQWYTLSLQPFSKVHLYSSDYKNSYTSRIGDINQVRNLSLMALLILIIACINYMNLATARFQKRAKEVAVNKTMGATVSQLVGRFYIETALLTFLALLLGLLLAENAIPLFNSIAGQHLNVGAVIRPEFIGGLVIIWLTVTLLAGSYPALYLSRFSPKALLQKTIQKEGSSAAIRKGLVVLQFVSSIALIAAVLVIYQQMNYIHTKNLGFNPQNVIAISTSGIHDPSQTDTFIDELKNQSSIVAVASAQGFPGVGVSGRSLYKNDEDEVGLPIQTNHGTYGVIDALGLHLLAGRDLPAVKADGDSTIQVVLNKKAIDYLGYTPKEAIGQKVKVGLGNNAYITGVVNNFNFASLHEPIGPYAFQNSTLESINVVLVRFKTKDVPGTMATIKNIFKKTIPTSVFDYTFLDRYMNTLYAADEQMAQIILIFSLLAIMIACLGLFGLATFMAEQRTKEIGVRKVLGASVTGIVGLLSKDFLKLVVIGFVIAVPIAWYVMNEWLADFAYKISITPWIFLLAGGVALLIALATVSWQSVKAALANPVDSLRSE